MHMRIVRDDESVNHYPKMTELCRLFPTLITAEGVEPFDTDELDTWACTKACHGGMLAAQFVLSVWSGNAGRSKRTRTIKEKGDVVAHIFRSETPWRCGPFDVVSAMGTWDRSHREAFMVWAHDPWWP